MAPIAVVVAILALIIGVMFFTGGERRVEPSGTLPTGAAETPATPPGAAPGAATTGDTGGTTGIVPSTPGGAVVPEPETMPAPAPAPAPVN